MAQQWYYKLTGISDAAHGPVSGRYLKELVRAGHLQPQDRVSKDGVKGWIRAERVRGLFETVVAHRPAAANQPGIIHVAEAVKTAEEIKKEKDEENGKFAKKGCLGCLGLLFILAGAGSIGTGITGETHQEAEVPTGMHFAKDILGRVRLDRLEETTTKMEWKTKIPEKERPGYVIGGVLLLVVAGGFLTYAVYRHINDK